MPHVVNGCGTWYYGRGNKIAYQGVCEQCQSHTTMEAYDTRLYVVVVFVPIIPLGKKRIIDDCKACRRHRAIPYKAWVELNERLGQTRTDFESDPTSDEKLELAVQASVSFRDLNSLRNLAGLIDKQESPSAKACFWLGIGFCQFHQYDEAKKYLSQSLAIEEDVETKEVLGEVHLNQNQPELAEPLLRHIVTDGISDRAHLIYHLGMCWQFSGNHDRALDTFKQVERLAPHLVDDEKFKTIRGESEKRRGTTVSVDAGKVLQKQKTAENWRKFFKIAPAALVVLLLGYLATCFIMGSSRTVHLANGLNVPYDITINDESYHLLPYQTIDMKVAEGAIQIDYPDARLGTAPAEVTINTPLWTRPFNDTVFVINPDRAAMFVKEYVAYAGQFDNPHIPNDELITSALLHTLDDIDHPFEAPPNSISMDRGDVEIRSILKLQIPSNEMGYRVTTMLIAQIDNAAAIEGAKQHVRMGSNLADALDVLATLGDKQDLKAFLTETANQQPDQLEIQLAYITAKDQANELTEVHTAYEQRAMAHPDNAVYQFLAAATDPSEKAAVDRCKALYAKGNLPPPAREWLAKRLLACGEFGEVVTICEKLIVEQYDNWTAVNMAIVALLALERYDDAIRHTGQAEMMDHQLAWRTFAQEAYIYGLRDDAAGIERVQNRLARKFNIFAPVLIKEFQDSIAANLAYSRQDFTNAAALYAGCTSYETLKFRGAIIAEDLATAEKIFDAIEEKDASDYADIYLLARKLGDDEASKRSLKRLVSLLEDGPGSQRLLAKALKDPDAVNWEDVLAILDGSASKATLLTVLGDAVPSHRVACFAMARTLNFDRRYPHYLLNHFLNSESGD